MNNTLLAVRAGVPMFRLLVRCFELLVLFALLIISATNRFGDGWAFMVVFAMSVVFYVVNEYWIPLITAS